MRTHIAAIASIVSGLAGAAGADEQFPPGSCPDADAAALRAALARSDAGEGAAADLDVAACYRALGQDFPESVALARALEAGLSEADAAAVNARLDAVGRPPTAERWTAVEGSAAQAAAATPEEGETAESPGSGVDPVWPYTLAAVAGAALVAGTVTGFVSLDQEASGESSTTMGIVGAVCVAVGIGAGVAALALWPGGEVAPAPGPGDVGMGVAVRF